MEFRKSSGLGSLIADLLLSERGRVGMQNEEVWNDFIKLINIGFIYFRRSWRVLFSLASLHSTWKHKHIAKCCPLHSATPRKLCKASPLVGKAGGDKLYWRGSKGWVSSVHLDQRVQTQMGNNLHCCSRDSALLCGTPWSADSPAYCCVGWHSRLVSPVVGISLQWLC